MSRILVFDESALTRRFYKTALPGHELVDVEGVDELLRQLDGAPPDLLLCDPATSGPLAGIKLVEKLIAHFARERVIVCGSQRLAEVERMGVGFIVKPVQRQSLLSAVLTRVGRVAAAPRETTLPSEAQRDVLQELLAVGFARVEAVISELTGDEAELAAKELRLLPRSEIPFAARDTLASVSGAVVQQLSGRFGGRAVLLLPAEQTPLLLGSIAKAEPAADWGDEQRDAAMELGKLVLNACVATLAEVVEVVPEQAPLTLELAEPLAQFERVTSRSPVQPHAMFVPLRLTLRRRGLTATLALVVEGSALERVLEAVRKFGRG